MILKNLALAAALLLLAFATATASAQAAKPKLPAKPNAAPSPTAPTTSGNPTAQPAGGADNPAASPATGPEAGQGAGQGAAVPGQGGECQGGPCDATPSHITIATPAPAAAPWPWQDRIAWAAHIILVVLAYVGVMLAIWLLRKIERQSHYAETTAQAAADSAKAALMYAEAQALTQRPWLVVTVEPEPGPHNRFTIVATNRGRSPTRIVTLVDEIATARDEAHLPPSPAFKNEAKPPRAPIILLPGEATGLKTFSRDDVKSVVETAEDLRRVEAWESKIYLFGVVTYIDLRAPAGKEPYETGWCCWYIHGHQKSGMVIAGTPEYNRHT
jgi:hypothetical protein